MYKKAHHIINTANRNIESGLSSTCGDDYKLAHKSLRLLVRLAKRVACAESKLDKYQRENMNAYCALRDAGFSDSAACKLMGKDGK